MLLRSLSRKRIASTTFSTSAVGVGVRARMKGPPPVLPALPSAERAPLHSGLATGRLTRKPAQRDAVQHGLGLLGVAPVGLAHGGHHHGGVHCIYADLCRARGGVSARGWGALGSPGRAGRVAGATSAGLTLCGPSSRAITLVSMSMAPLQAPVKRAHVSGAWAGGRRGAGPERWGSLTVDGVVADGALGGLAGHVHDGPRGSARHQAPSHDLQWQKEPGAALAGVTCPFPLLPRRPLTWDTWMTALRFTSKELETTDGPGQDWGPLLQGAAVPPSAPPPPGLTCHRPPW